MTVITLTTDFGITGGYVAAMKGVVLGINQQATIVDVTHEIRPQNIPEASFVLSTVYKYFPKGTIHLAVVDPGVGTTRRAIALKTPDFMFVGPDNGLFTFTLRDICGGQQLKVKDGKIELPGEITAVDITNKKYWREPVSATFHGRDIFATVAAHLSLGVPLSEFGEKISEVLTLHGYQPVRKSPGVITGHVVYIDHFGNVITDVNKSDLQSVLPEISAEINGHTISKFVKTYAEGEGLVALIGSSNYLEIALPDGNAAESIKAKVGDELIFKAK